MRSVGLRSLFWKTVCSVLLLSPMLVAQDSDNADPESAKLIKKKQRILVVGPDDKPIANASFKPWGLNSNYFWPTKQMGPATAHRTNADGIAEVDYPETIGGTVQCTSIDGVVAHPDYIRAIARVTVSESKDFEVKLKQGVSFKLKAVDEDGKPLSKPFSVVMSGDTPPENWNDLGNGTIESKAIPNGDHQAMIVMPGTDGKTCFSEPLFIRVGEKDREKGVLLEDVEVYVGTRLTGKISDNVPRPIRDGQVMALQAPMPIEDPQNLGIETLRWGEWVPIREDGSFEFISLPRSGKIQMIAKCDGFVGKADDRGFTIGESFEIEEVETRVTLEMTPTIDVEIVVTDKAGLPISGADVGFNPNQRWAGWGSQILGERWKSMADVVARLDPTKSVPESEMTFRDFSSETDAEGIARIRNLPQDERNFYVGKKEYEVQEQVEISFDPAQLKQTNGRRVFRKKVVLLKEEK
jgi:hypothetical protein